MPTSSSLDITNSPFDPDTLISLEVELPPARRPLYVSIKDDSDFHIPFIERVYNESPLFAQIPPRAHCNTWIVSIDAEEPIMASTAISELKRHQRPNVTSKLLLFSLGLATSPVCDFQDQFALQKLRSIFSWRLQETQ